jgi:hypothetical protein
MDNNELQNGEQLEKPMSLGDWVITLIIMAIPCVGLVMMFVWGFGKSGNTSRKNYCRATLIFAAVGIILGFAFYGAIIASLANAFSSMGY